MDLLIGKIFKQSFTFEKLSSGFILFFSQGWLCLDKARHLAFEDRNLRTPAM